MSAETFIKTDFYLTLEDMRPENAGTKLEWLLIETANRARTPGENRALRQLRLIVARTKGTHTKAEWEALLMEFDYSCARCGASDTQIHKDHILPIYLGGSDGIDNIQPLCRKCNTAKSHDSTNWVSRAREMGAG